jgi:small subunit ribosomal protein S18
MSEETNNSRSAMDAGDAGGARGGFQRDKDTPEGGRKGRRRRKVSYLTLNKIYTVDYKEVNILRRFLNDRGKILPSRQSGNTASQQRMISTAIHRAREMALLPFTVTEMSAERREYGGRERRYQRPDRNEQPQAEPRAEAPKAAPAAEAPKAAPAAEAPAEA